MRRTNVAPLVLPAILPAVLPAVLVAVILCAGLLMPIAPATSAASAPLPVPALGQSVASAASLLDARNRTKARWKVKVRGWTKPVKRGGQAKINRCKATLYWGSLPGTNEHPAWLAGHDRCGFWRWDKWLPVGSKFKVVTPAGKILKYRVYGRDIINRNSGTSDGLIRGDITLQTCRGPRMTFVYARRTG